ncbi:MAG: fluoride efflux transporter CrcB [Gammaproteobacteria bacterium]|nr:fluoride efflux transporter CrcB [Gammaproteobacteria bacterium]
MNQLLAISAGGAIGAVLRFVLSNGIHQLLGRGFPYGTLTVNVLGSLCMGLGYVLLIEQLPHSTLWRSFLLVGVLGALTTFSTFSIETLLLLEQGKIVRAAISVAANLLLSLMAVWLGIQLGRMLYP